VAPVPGETKGESQSKHLLTTSETLVNMSLVWQYITLMKRIYMIDCPGIVPPNQQDSDEELLLRGSIRVGNVEWPAQYVEAVLRRVEPKHLQRTYKDSTSFLELLCRKQGRLLKGGEPDLDAVARIVLNDWIRGKIPWYTPLPVKEDGTGGSVQGVEGREGRLGEMPRKRKRGSEATESVAAINDTDAVEVEDEDVDDEFEGFSEDGGLQLDISDGEDIEDVEENAEGLEGDADTKTLVAEETSENDQDVDDEVAAISAALSSAKKRRRKA
jgi:nuclear GTP-binding protein